MGFFLCNMWQKFWRRENEGLATFHIQGCSFNFTCWGNFPCPTCGKSFDYKKRIMVGPIWGLSLSYIFRSQFKIMAMQAFSQYLCSAVDKSSRWAFCNCQLLQDTESTFVGATGIRLCSCFYGPGYFVRFILLFQFPDISWKGCGTPWILILEGHSVLVYSPFQFFCLPTTTLLFATSGAPLVNRKLLLTSLN